MNSPKMIPLGAASADFSCRCPLLLLLAGIKCSVMEDWHLVVIFFESLKSRSAQAAFMACAQIQRVAGYILIKGSPRRLTCGPYDV